MQYEDMETGDINTISTEFRELKDLIDIEDCNFPVDNKIMSGNL